VSLPRWSYVANIGWQQRALGAQLTAHGFSAGVYDTSYIQCTSGCPASTPDHMTIETNHLPGAIYFDANISFKLLEEGEVFLSVDNIANKAPAQVACGTNIGGAPLSVNQALYDTLGRRFRVGVRFRM
jgi:iron complex outermembrane recepter protein